MSDALSDLLAKLDRVRKRGDGWNAQVATATGLTIQRLSLAERGIVTLNRVETASLESFLKARLEAEFERMTSVGGKTAPTRGEIRP